MNIIVTAELLDLFRRYRLSTVPGGGERWREGDELIINPHSVIEPYAHIFQGNVIPLALGAFTYTHSQCDLAVAIGRYSSIAMALSFMGADHPTDWATTSPFCYEPGPLGGVQAYFNDIGKEAAIPISKTARPAWVKIGNDVTVGGAVMFKRGITIGDGAIIGARSLVTRDVEPYSIVGGSPARIIRKRFPDELIARFLASRWWQYGPEILQRLPAKNPEGFLDGLEAAIAAGAAPLALEPMTGVDIIRAARFA